MIEEGADAPTVSLPAYVDGERRRVDLGEDIGEGIVVLAFYPADFSPGCDAASSDLGDLDLFTMQKDVSVFGISPDSTFSHEAFAERYGLRVPLLSDVDGEAAAAYDVAHTTDAGEQLSQRAVFVVDHRGVVRYAWATDDLAERPDVEPIKAAVGDIGGDETALERYRVGVDHYRAGRDAFEDAMAAYEEREWMDARGGFADAEPAFAAAADHLDTAVRFAETDAFEALADRADEKAETLRRAADWLGKSADALASGRGRQGTDYREDAERQLDAAAALPEPAPPADVTLTDDGIELAESVVVDPDAADVTHPARAGGDLPDTDLGVDDAELDAAMADEGSDYDDPADGGEVTGDLDATTDGDERADEDAETASIEGDTVQGDLEMDLDAVEAASHDPAAEKEPDDDRPADESAVDAESGAATVAPDASPGARDSTAEVDQAAVDEGADAADEREDAATEDGGAADDEAVVELDLADPTAGDDDEDDDERANWDIPGQ